jgi:hypothetical protein
MWTIHGVHASRFGSFEHAGRYDRWASRFCIEDFQQCRLVESHHALVSFRRTIGVVSLTIARWPPQRVQLRR